MKTALGFFMLACLLFVGFGCVAYVDPVPYSYYYYSPYPAYPPYYYGYPSYYPYRYPSFYWPPVYFNYYQYRPYRHYHHRH